jgi:hypothetical protein
MTRAAASRLFRNQLISSSQDCAGCSCACRGGIFPDHLSATDPIVYPSARWVWRNRHDFAIR